MRFFVTGAASERFFRHRLTRICAPFVVFLPILGLSMGFLTKWTSFAFTAPQNDPLRRALDSSLYANGWWLLDLKHLWFLWHLILIVAVFFVIWPLVVRTPWIKSPLTWLRRLVEHPVSFLIFVGGFAVAYCLIFRWDSLPTDTSWSPRADLVLLYALSFFFGALTFKANVQLATFGRFWPLYALVGSICIGLRYFDSQHGRTFPAAESGLIFEGYAATQGLGMVTLSAATLGIFWKYLGFRSRLWRYLSDSAYWVYLIHLPFALQLPHVWNAFGLPIEVYGPATLVFTTLFAYASYESFVRSTWVGIFLNGRRYFSKRTGRLIWGGLGLFALGLFGHVLVSHQTVSLSARNAGGALHCLPPNLKLSGPFRSGGFAAGRGCAPLDDFIACIEKVPFEASYCERLGALLPVPADMNSELEATLLRGPSTNYWVGVSDQGVEGEWRSRDGHLVSELPWMVNEPNDWASAEDCAVYSQFGKLGESLNDVSCQQAQSLLCHFPKTKVSIPDHLGTVYRIHPSSQTLKECTESLSVRSDWRISDRHSGAFVSLGLRGVYVLRDTRDELYGFLGGIDDGVSSRESMAGIAWETNSRSLWTDNQCRLDDADGGELRVRCGRGSWLLVREP